MVSKIGKMEYWSDGVMECWRKENFGFQISDFKYLAHPINPICNLYPGEFSRGRLLLAAFHRTDQKSAIEFFAITPILHHSSAPGVI